MFSQLQDRADPDRDHAEHSSGEPEDFVVPAITGIARGGKGG